MNLNLCSDGHDEIVFPGKNCPVCEKETEIYDLRLALGEANSLLTYLKQELEISREKEDL